MYLVHVAAKDIPADSGLKRAPAGLDETLVLVKNEDSMLTDTMNLLDILTGVHLF
jgi:hypothetical protein